jgi:hypothetical protein
LVQLALMGAALFHAEPAKIHISVNVRSFSGGIFNSVRRTNAGLQRARRDQQEE